MHFLVNDCALGTRMIISYLLFSILITFTRSLHKQGVIALSFVSTLISPRYDLHYVEVEQTNWGNGDVFVIKGPRATRRKIQIMLSRGSTKAKIKDDPILKIQIY